MKSSCGTFFLIFELSAGISTSDYERRVKSIDIPVLIIAGDEDTDNGSPSDLAKVLPNGQLSIVKGDHNNTYKTLAFSERIVSFLRDK
jgi:pimeloyl-ACP methyl ester carboxylesterase